MRHLESNPPVARSASKTATVSPATSALTSHRLPAAGGASSDDAGGEGASTIDVVAPKISIADATAQTLMPAKMVVIAQSRVNGRTLAVKRSVRRKVGRVSKLRCNSVFNFGKFLFVG